MFFKWCAMYYNKYYFIITFCTLFITGAGTRTERTGDFVPGTVLSDDRKAALCGRGGCPKGSGFLRAGAKGAVKGTVRRVTLQRRGAAGELPLSTMFGKCLFCFMGLPAVLRNNFKLTFTLTRSLPLSIHTYSPPCRRCSVRPSGCSCSGRKRTCRSERCWTRSTPHWAVLPGIIAFNTTQSARHFSVWKGYRCLIILHFL